MKLREILDKYEPWGYNDFDIIKKYFQENHYEHQAIDMLTDFSRETIKNQHRYIDTLKEMYGYSDAIMCNENVDLKIRRKLVIFYQEYLRNGELYESSLEEIKKILEKVRKDLLLFPQAFLGYLQSKGIAENYGDSTDFRLEIIEKKGMI